MLINKETGEPLRVVEHIGCHYSKMFPSKGVGGAEYPYVLTGMVEAWGGNVIDYPERRHCCGYGFRQYHVKANRGYSLSNTHKKFESMDLQVPSLLLSMVSSNNMVWRACSLLLLWLVSCSFSWDYSNWVMSSSLFLIL